MRVSLAQAHDAGDHRVVGHARAAVADELTRAGRHDLIDDAQLVLSELITNALLHGGGCLDVHATAISEGIRLEVADPTRCRRCLATPLTSR